MSGKPRSLPCDEPSKFLLHVIDLIKNDPRTLSQIATETGISLNWLSNMVNLHHKNPSVNRIHFIYEMLTGSKLEY